MTPMGGLVVQIGDSPVVLARSGKALDAEGNKGVDHFADCRILTPEKGEYANETHFVTQDDWRGRLQPNILNPGRFSTILVMSDGAGDLVINRKQIFKPFSGSMIAKLLQARDGAERDQVLEALITDPRCDEVTGDDKTLVVMYSRHLDALATVPTISPPGAQQGVQTPSTQPMPPIPPDVTRPDKQPSKKLFSILLPVLILAGLLTWGASTYYPILIGKLTKTGKEPLPDAQKTPIPIAAGDTPKPVSQNEIQEDKTPNQDQENLDIVLQAHTEAKNRLEDSKSAKQFAQQKLDSMKNETTTDKKINTSDGINALANAARQWADHAIFQKDKARQAANAIAKQTNPNAEAVDRSARLAAEAETYANESSALANEVQDIARQALKMANQRINRAGSSAQKSASNQNPRETKDKSNTNTTAATKPQAPAAIITTPTLPETQSATPETGKNQ